jgi:dTDP-4-amino-4,6-dideoxygalactose transaminase
MEALKRGGIQTSIHYPPVHHFSIYEDEWKKRGSSLPVTEEAASREVTLPLYPTMQEEQVHWVAQAIKEALQEMDVK